MLACPQDIFFHNDTNRTLENGVDRYQNLILDSSNALLQSTLSAEFQHNDKINRQNQLHRGQLLGNNDIDLNNEDNLIDNLAVTNNNMKDKEEQVWPPDVESAFIEALESIPKLGRRKILVNGKPCGRNELISDFIFRKTCKIRTRKQVSSHIQVLKNTRKGDTHFMRLLTDSVEQDENNNPVNQNRNNLQNNIASKLKMRQPPHLRHSQTMKNNITSNGAFQMKKFHSNDNLSSDDSSINSSPSPTDYVFEIMCGDPIQQQALSMLQFKDIYDPFQQSLFSGVLSGSTNNTPGINFDANNAADPFFGSDILYDQTQNGKLEESLINNLPVVATTIDSLPTTPDVSLMKRLNNTKMNNSKKRKSLHDESANDLLMNFSDSVIDSKCALWPNYICLYLEYSLPYDPCRPLSHNLSQMPHCYLNCLPTVSIDSISKEKCPLISSLSQNLNDTVLLLAKAKLDLNLNISDFAFNNTSFFETQTRRTIECSTTIYSFGNVVLESKEVQQALWVNEGKYMYSFVFVNQFFDAFMKGIRSLQSWDEVDIAINNLCIVQSFEDMESKYITGNNSNIAVTDATEPVLDSNTSPLLVMMYEFERGQGSIDISTISSNKKSKIDIVTESLDFLNQDN